MKRWGVVQAVGAGERLGWVRVLFPDLGLVSDWLPVLSAGGHGAKHWAPIGQGSQVCTLMDERDEDGVVLGAVWGPAPHDPPSGAGPSVWLWQMPDGGVLRYDAGAHHLEAKMPTGGTIRLEASGGITLKGPVTVDGTLDATGNITAPDATLSGKVFSTHIHMASGGVGLGGVPYPPPVP